MNDVNDQSNLMEAFTEASYFVRIANNWVKLKIGQPCPEVAKAAEFKTWAIITAYNPGGTQVSDDDNRKQHQFLDEETQCFERRLEAYGTGEGWPKEHGFFLVGISRDQAISIAKKYGQAAFVFGTDVPELIWPPLTA